MKSTGLLAAILALWISTLIGVDVLGKEPQVQFVTGKVDSLNTDSAFYCGSTESDHVFAIVEDEVTSIAQIPRSDLKVDREVGITSNLHLHDLRYYYPTKIEQGKCFSRLPIIEAGRNDLGSPILSLRVIPGYRLFPLDALQPSVVVFDKGYLRYVERQPAGHIFYYGKMSEDAWNHFSRILVQLVGSSSEKEYEFNNASDQPTTEIGIIVNGEEFTLVSIYGFVLETRTVNRGYLDQGVVIPSELTPMIAFIETLPIERIGVSVVSYDDDRNLDFKARKPPTDTLDAPIVEPAQRPSIRDLEGIKERFRSTLFKDKNSANLP